MLRNLAGRASQLLKSGFTKPSQARAFASNSIDQFNVHKESATDEPGWEWTSKNLERAKAILAKYPTNWKQSAMIPLLDLAQQQVGIQHDLILS